MPQIRLPLLATVTKSYCLQVIRLVHAEMRQAELDAKAVVEVLENCLLEIGAGLPMDAEDVNQVSRPCMTRASAG